MFRNSAALFSWTTPNSQLQYLRKSADGMVLPNARGILEALTNKSDRNAFIWGLDLLLKRVSPGPKTFINTTGLDLKPILA